MRKLKASTSGIYYWSEPVSETQPATFHGYPVYENNYLGDSEIYFGDFKKGFSKNKSLLVERLRAKTVNCWKTLTLKARAISIEASKQLRNVQRLRDEIILARVPSV